MNAFSPNVCRAAFVIVDMQNFSCAPLDGKPMPGIAAVIERMNWLAGICRRKGIPVI